jgi:hypothetical protein
MQATKPQLERTELSSVGTLSVVRAAGPGFDPWIGSQASPQNLFFVSQLSHTWMHHNDQDDVPVMCEASKTSDTSQPHASLFV